MAFMGDDQMIVYGDSQSPCGGHDLAGQGLVGFRGFQASRRMVVLCVVVSYVELTVFE